MIDLGSLGGTTHNAATAISSHGHVVGFSNLPGDTNSHAFLWTKDRGMKDLGTLTGDVFSAAFGINNKDQVVGLSCDANGNCRGFLWKDGVMTDLNTLIPPGSPLFLFYAGDINSRGEIVGEAFEQSTGEPLVLGAPSGEENPPPRRGRGGRETKSTTKKNPGLPSSKNLQKLPTSGPPAFWPEVVNLKATPAVKKFPSRKHGLAKTELTPNIFFSRPQNRPQKIHETPEG